MSETSSLPIVVDLGGTLCRTISLGEALVAVLLRNMSDIPAVVRAGLLQQLFPDGFAYAIDRTTGKFVWGLPFFLGRTIFIGIEGQAVVTSALAVSPAVTKTGPWIAY